MSREKSEALASFLRRSADQYLRCVLYYEGQEYSIIYMRDDLEGEPPEAADNLTWELQEMSQRGEDDNDPYGFGGLRCTIRCFGEVVEMHFPFDDDRGASVTLDPQATEELYSFVGDCLTVIETQ